MAEIKTYVGRWIVPISKEYKKKEAALVVKRVPNLDEYRLAYMESKKWVIVRKLTKDDIKSLDFVKYVRSFKFKNIVRVEKINPKILNGISKI